MNTIPKKKLLLGIGGGILLYLLSTAISYATFRYFSSSSISPALINPTETGGVGGKINVSGPKTEACPLNGQKYTAEERKVWEGRRPLTIMVENHLDSRPHSGLSKSDVVYEAVAEGGITRFLAVFYCGVAAQDTQVGQVRSARVYYMDFASEYGDYPLYVHAGGANDFSGSGDTAAKVKALEKISTLNWQMYNDLNYDRIGLPTFWRDTERLGHEVAWEHTLYSSTEKLWDLAHKRGLDATDKDGGKWNANFVQWKFKDDAGSSQRGQATDINFDFWPGYKDYAVEWKYNSETNEYQRLNGGQEEKDRDDDSLLKAKVVVVQLMKEEGPLDRNKHLYYYTTGTGKAIVFQDGQAIQATWAKKDRQSRTIFTDSKGKQITFNRGQIWIEVVPAGGEVKY